MQTQELRFQLRRSQTFLVTGGRAPCVHTPPPYLPPSAEHILFPAFSPLPCIVKNSRKRRRRYREDDKLGTHAYLRSIVFLLFSGKKGNLHVQAERARLCFLRVSVSYGLPTYLAYLGSAHIVGMPRYFTQTRAFWTILPTSINICILPSLDICSHKALSDHIADL